MMARQRIGAALIEALVALVLLATTGVAMVSHVLQTIEAARLAVQRDNETRAASATLDRVRLWSGSEIAVRMGRTRLPCCEMIIQPLSRALYHVTLVDTLTGAAILETTIYTRDAVP
jgi:Tfp pilus assembly protein PilV